MTKKLCGLAFTKSVNDKGETFLEGWANAAVVDRGNDLLKKSAWKLDNFKKNGMILFNHDRMQPVGKAVLCEARDEGLYIKCKLSKSKHPDIQKVRDLVEEGVLNAFSVGFQSKTEEKGMDGVNEIKEAELYEVSIVSVPMNQDSLFTVSVKDLLGMTLNEARSKILGQKGAWFASAIHDRIYSLQEAGDFDRTAALEQVVKDAGSTVDEVNNVLAGNVTPVPPKMVEAFANVFSLNPEELAKMDAGDTKVAPPAKPADDADKKPDDKPADEKPTETAPDEEPATDEEKGGDEEMAEEKAVNERVYALLVPKSVSEEDAKKLATEAGYSVDNLESDESYHKFVQLASDQFEGDMREEDVGDGCKAIMGTLTVDASKALFESEDGIADDAKPVGSGCKPEPKKDPKKKPKDKQANQETQPTVPVQPGGIGVQDMNPYLAQATQTNVLLGTLIAAIQTLSDAIGKMGAPAPISAPPVLEPEPKADDIQEEDDPALAKMLGQVAESMVDLDVRYKNLGV